MSTMAMDIESVQRMLLGGLPPEAYDITVSVVPVATETEDSGSECSPATEESPAPVEDAA